jgi:hypothetical protein
MTDRKATADPSLRSDDCGGGAGVCGFPPFPQEARKGWETRLTGMFQDEAVVLATCKKILNPRREIDEHKLSASGCAVADFQPDDLRGLPSSLLILAKSESFVTMVKP